MKRFPWIATLVVLAAVGLMLRLGYWQMERLHQKEAMIAHYMAAQGDQSVHEFGKNAIPFNRVRLTCLNGSNPMTISGRNAVGRAGWAHLASCDVLGGGRAEIILGWSSGPGAVVWAGGPVTGVWVDRGKPVTPNAPARIVADPPLAGLEANARPDPRDLPNNHLSYAVQWFLFAATALLIYAIALRRRLTQPPQ